MTKYNQDITVRQGTKVTLRWIVRNQAGSLLTTIEDYTVVLVVAETNLVDAAEIAELARTSASNITLDNGTGSAETVINADDTDGLEAKSYYYVLKTTAPDEHDLAVGYFTVQSSPAGDK